MTIVSVIPKTNSVIVKSRDKEIMPLDIMEFKGDDAFYQLYKFLAEKYGFNGDEKK